MTASASNARLAAAPLLLGLLLFGGCKTPSAPPLRAPIEPLATRRTDADESFRTAW